MLCVPPFCSLFLYILWLFPAACRGAAHAYRPQGYQVLSPQYAACSWHMLSFRLLPCSAPGLPVQCLLACLLVVPLLARLCEKTAAHALPLAPPHVHLASQCPYWPSVGGEVRALCSMASSTEPICRPPFSSGTLTTARLLASRTSCKPCAGRHCWAWWGPPTGPLPKQCMGPGTTHWLCGSVRQTLVYFLVLRPPRPQTNTAQKGHH